MADLFVSYARQDKDRVAPLVAALAREGWSVWWDPEIVPGQEFDRLITQELRAAKAVIVVWTPASVESRWVRGEARIAAERGVLVPVRFESASLPIDAMAMHTTDLDDWKGNTEHPGFQGLVRALRTLVARAVPAPQAAGLAQTPQAATPSATLQVAQARPSFGMSPRQLVPLLAIALTVVAVLAFMLINRNATPQGAASREARSGAEAGSSLSSESSSANTASSAAPREAASSAPSKPRLAVLPFANFSPDPNNAFFTDGMHEEILTKLAISAPGLEVISRTTMMMYKEHPASVEQIAKDLGCTHVLEGSVRREGNAVRLTLQLIDAKTDQHLWAQDYDRTLTNALTLQSEVAGEVAKQLSVQLAGGPNQDAAPTRNTEAYDLYLKARVAMQAADPGRSNNDLLTNIHNVQSLLTQAIAADPSFGLAYLARAASHYFEAQLSQPQYAPISEEMLRPAREDLNVAARLMGENDARVVAFRAPLDASTSAVDPNKALAALEAADAAHVTDADVLRTKAQLYAVLGRMPEAIEIVKGLVALDPANFALLTNYQIVLQAAHKPAEAMKIFNILMSRPDAPPIVAILRARLILEWTGDPGPLNAAIDEFGPRVDPDVLLNFKSDLLTYSHRYAEFKTLVLLSRNTGIRYFVAGAPVSANLPTAILQGFAGLLTGDEALAKTAGEAMINGVQAVPESFPRHLVLATLAEGHAMTGNKAKAIEAAREAIKLTDQLPSALARRLANVSCAVALAWSGAGDEAVDILERSSTSDWGLTPAEIARQPLFTVPLANNARYRALKAKLEAQMAATNLE